MKLKKISLFLLMFICLFMVTGCDKETETKLKTIGKVHEHCTRAGSINGATVQLDYDIYYKGENLTMLISNEKVITEDQDILDQYETAYKEVNKDYEDLDHYIVKVERDHNSVLSYSEIDFEKVDTNYLLKLEGEEDNIYENGKAKVEKWKSFAKKFGTECEVVK